MEWSSNYPASVLSMVKVISACNVGRRNCTHTPLPYIYPHHMSNTALIQPHLMFYTSTLLLLWWAYSSPPPHPNPSPLNVWFDNIYELVSLNFEVEKGTSPWRVLSCDYCMKQWEKTTFRLWFSVINYWFMNIKTKILGQIEFSSFFKLNVN
jgi:hypothetical protein